MEEIEEVIYLMMSLMFLLMGIVLVLSIVASVYNPYDQMAFANVEKLRSAMNEACFETGDQPVKTSFEMPQNVPAFSGLFSILPAWVMKTGGDPNYVLYYESFPPGEAIGWEVYQATFKDRLITSLPDGWGNGEKGTAEVEAYAKKVLTDYKSLNKDSIVDAVVIDNIILDDIYRSDFIIKKEKNTGNPTDEFETGGEARENAETKGFFGYGKWSSDSYKFQNYAGLTALEKTSIKYQPCGENTLCLKTRNGVYKFPLDACKGVGYIQLVYDARGKLDDAAISGLSFATGAMTAIIALVTPGIKLPAGAVAASYISKGLKYQIALLLSIKASEFYAVSPCSISEIKITKTDCGGSIYTCVNMFEYPLYKYNENGKLESAGTHYICLDNMYSSTTAPRPNSCLLLQVSDTIGDYCWTPDPYNEIAVRDYYTKEGWFKQFFETYLDVFTLKFAQMTNMYPVFVSRLYVFNLRSYVLAPPWDMGKTIKKLGIVDLWSWPNKFSISIA